MARLVDLRRTFRDRDSLQAILDAQTPQPPNRRYTADELARIRDADAQTIRDVRLLAVDSAATAEGIARRAAVHHGTTPAQVAAFLRDEEARVRS